MVAPQPWRVRFAPHARAEAGDVALLVSRLASGAVFNAAVGARGGAQRAVG